MNLKKSKSRTKNDNPTFLKANVFFMKLGESLNAILGKALEEAGMIDTVEGIEQFRVKYLGRKGKLAEVSNGFKALGFQERRKVGKKFNEVKEEIEQIVAESVKRLKKAGEALFDFSRPGVPVVVGHRHPISQTIRQLKKIFIGLGFSIVEGPEIVTEEDNFDALNIPRYHPARDLWDTLWVKTQTEADDMHAVLRRNQRTSASRSQQSTFLFRTHTSAYQVPYMRQHQPPFRIVIPGKVFRYEATDRTHDFQFHQLEGLAVDKNLSLGHLKWTVTELLKQLFKRKVEVRFRPGYFPFVEPGVEVDLRCVLCNPPSEGLRRKNSSSLDAAEDRKCAVCKDTGWIELMGAGMVHPNVFEAAGYLPREWQGFAFGFGIDRLAMIKWRIDDIRLFTNGDVRFVRQF